MGDTVSLGLTKRFRVWAGYDDVVGYDSWAYAGGTAIGTGVNVGLGVVNPCALGSTIGIPVRLINAGQAIGGTINAGENIANGNYWEAGFDLVGVAGNAGQVLRPCFAAGTPIRTKTGEIPIENLQVGDRVLSRNEFDPNGEVDEKIVEDVFVRSAPILNVVVRGRVIRTTSEHPFWVDGKGWTAAGELKAGDNLLSAEKSKLPVENVSETGDTETVYNFRVADWHTYFVGNEDWDFEVWVHNACFNPNQSPLNPAHYGIDLGKLQPTVTVGAHIPKRPYISSLLFIQTIIESGPPRPDPRGVLGALRWDALGTFWQQGMEEPSHGIYELVIEPTASKILHFGFTGRNPW